MVVLRDLHGNPLANREVRLEVNRESIAEGNSTRIIRAHLFRPIDKRRMSGTLTS